MGFRFSRSYAASGEKPVTGGVDFFQLLPEDELLVSANQLCSAGRQNSHGALFRLAK
jgi:hypothetical protein